MKQLIFSLFLLTILSGCTPQHIKEADRIINNFSCEMKKDGFILLGSGGEMMGNIKKFHLSYEKVTTPSVDQARIILIEEAEKFLSIINIDTRIFPYLDNYPFTLKNINLDLFFLQNNGDLCLSPNIATAFIHNTTNKIVYTQAG